MFTGKVGITTTGFTVTTVVVKSAPAVAVTVVVPAETAVNKPVVELMVPTVELALDHVVVAGNALPY
jgi:hypothetical protein